MSLELTRLQMEEALLLNVPNWERESLEKFVIQMLEQMFTIMPEGELETHYNAMVEKQNKTKEKEE